MPQTGGRGGGAWGSMTPFPCVVYRVWAGPLIGPGCQPIRCSMVMKVTPCCSEGRVAELLRPSLRLTESPPRWVGLSLVLNSSLCYLRDQMEQLTHWPCLGWARGGWIETLFFFFLNRGLRAKAQLGRRARGASSRMGEV